MARNNSNCRVSIDLNQNCLHIGAILKDLMETSVFNLWHYNGQNQSTKFYNFVLLRNTFHIPPIIPPFPPPFDKRGSLKIKFLKLFFFSQKRLGTKFKNWRNGNSAFLCIHIMSILPYWSMFQGEFNFSAFWKILKNTCKKFQKFLLKQKLLNFFACFLNFALPTQQTRL